MYRITNKAGLRRHLFITLAVLFAFVLSFSLTSGVSAQAADDEDIIRAYEGLVWAPDGLAGGQCYLGGVSAEDVPLDFSLGTEAEERRLALMQVLMTDFNLTPEQAAGIIGNFMWESGGAHLPPDVNEFTDVPGPPEFDGGYGWAQWTGVRQENFINYAVENGYMESENVHATDAANYAFLKHELTTGYTETIDALKALSSPEDAAVSFHNTFEKSSSLDPERSEYALQVYNEFIDSGGTVTTTCVASGSATIVGEYAFPLITTKSGIGNPGIFNDGTTDVAGHPYTAYDIFADPGTPVAAFISGVVTRITEDRCPGRMISIYNEGSDLTVSYLHLNFNGHVGLGETVSAGQQIATVGPSANACDTPPHLHIDAVNGEVRPSCSRLNCPPQNAAYYVDIGPELYETYQALPG